MGPSGSQRPVLRNRSRRRTGAGHRRERNTATERPEQRAAHPHLEYLHRGRTVVGYRCVVSEPRCQTQLQTIARRWWRHRLHHPPLGARGRRVSLVALPP
ncbi:hypothetical protein [Hoylesella pleuritidis]|uniref:hypothetical protein n=1 Tax=Hoylesella pleuritidis TaxID=407975 RepID=UPI0028D2BE45|nr:hypothetical protein [Hoylesella pleuritidis]